MTRYIIRRSLQSIALLLLATLIGFSVYQMAPGGPLQFLEENPQATQADFDRLERSYGIDRNIAVQYVSWLLGEDWLPQSDFWRSGRCQLEPERCARGIIRMDFGRSFSNSNRPAIDVIVERIPATFVLGIATLFFSIVIGVPLGIISALTRGRWADNTIRVSTVFINTLPDWYIGLVMLIIFGGYLKLVPLGGMQTIGDGSLPDRLHHLILPALVGATGGWIGFSRILRFEMLDVLHQDYVRTAYAKGLARNTVIVRHVLRNAMMPFVTGLSGIFLLILSGSLLFEIVFSWPGMGRLAIDAINSRDYPVMMALFVISSFLGILGLLMVDILYSVVDPRVRYDRTVA